MKPIFKQILAGTKFYNRFKQRFHCKFTRLHG